MIMLIMDLFRIMWQINQLNISINKLIIHKLISLYYHLCYILTHSYNYRDKYIIMLLRWLWTFFSNDPRPSYFENINSPKLYFEHSTYMLYGRNHSDITQINLSLQEQDLCYDINIITNITKKIQHNNLYISYSY